MGTHMWTSTVSRRGRRMSLELPLTRPLNISQQDAEFLHHRPDLFYPYLPPPFLNGMTHPKVCILLRLYPLLNQNSNPL